MTLHEGNKARNFSGLGYFYWANFLYNIKALKEVFSIMPKLGYPWTLSSFVFILGLVTKDHKFYTPRKPLNSNNKRPDNLF